MPGAINGNCGYKQEQHPFYGGPYIWIDRADDPGFLYERANQCYDNIMISLLNFRPIFVDGFEGSHVVWYNFNLKLPTLVGVTNVIKTSELWERTL